MSTPSVASTATTATAPHPTSLPFTAAENALIDTLAHNKKLLGTRLVEATKRGDARLKEICQAALKHVPYTPVEKTAMHVLGSVSPVVAAMAHTNNEAEAEEAGIAHFSAMPDIKEFYKYCLKQGNYPAHKLAMIKKAVERAGK